MTPGELWRSWNLQPVVVAGLVAAAALYAEGVSVLWRHGGVGRGVRTWQAACFGGGLVTLAVALVSPLDPLSSALLSAHMGQHFLLIMVAPPLLVLGAPLIALSAIAPRGWRSGLRRAGRLRPIHAAVRFLTHPLVSWFAALVALWTWHLPPLYQAALRLPALHLLEHASFSVTGLLFWWTALHPAGRRHLARGMDVLYVFTGGFQGAVLGALFVFASSPLYPYYGGSVRAWGLTPLTDQQLAGAIMWIPSGVVYLAVAGVLFVQWLGAVERDTRREEERQGMAVPRRVAVR